jgi:hypothetical protein
VLVGVEKAANEGPEWRNRNGDIQMGMLHKHVQSDSIDFVKRTDNGAVHSAPHPIESNAWELR